MCSYFSINIKDENGDGEIMQRDKYLEKDDLKKGKGETLFLNDNYTLKASLLRSVTRQECLLLQLQLNTVLEVLAREIKTKN